MIDLHKLVMLDQMTFDPVSLNKHSQIRRLEIYHCHHNVMDDLSHWTENITQQ
jgi:hypothetical protein